MNSLSNHIITHICSFLPLDNIGISKTIDTCIINYASKLYDHSKDQTRKDLIPIAIKSYILTKQINNKSIITCYCGNSTSKSIKITSKEFPIPLDRFSSGDAYFCKHDCIARTIWRSWNYVFMKDNSTKYILPLFGQKGKYVIINNIKTWGWRKGKLYAITIKDNIVYIKSKYNLLEKSD